MIIPVIRVSIAFANGMPDNTLITFARNILATVYAAEGYTAPPVTAAALEAGVDAFEAAKIAQPTGGKPATADKNQKRMAVETMLKSLAYYAQTVANNDLAMLLASGLEATSANRTRMALSKPSVLRIVAGMTGQAILSLSTENNVRGCEARAAELDDEGTPGEFGPAFFSTNSRNIVVSGLTPGKRYTFMGRTMGGTTGYSNWSDQVVQRAA